MATIEAMRLVHGAGAVCSAGIDVANADVSRSLQLHRHARPDRLLGRPDVRWVTLPARGSEPRFELNREREDVVRQWAVVEGMPLGRQPAAVWTRYFHVAEIVNDLKAGGAMLVEQQSGRVPRHRTIAMAFKHS